MTKGNKIRLHLLLLARNFKRSARKMKHDGFEHGSRQLRASGEAYHHAAKIVKYGEAGDWP